MERVAQPHADAATSEEACAGCGRVLHQRWSFAFKSKSSSGVVEIPDQAVEMTKCLLCALRHLPMLKRSWYACLVVGTVLTALNQGDILLSGQWNNALYWKIPLTYCVPFLVSTYGALINNRK